MVLAGVAVAAAVVVADFVVATTFTGDDHLFLAYARHEPQPLAAFVSDRHGGEYYRPVPMLLWWALARVAPGSAVPFALAALALHGAAAVFTAALARALGWGRAAAGLAGALFLLAPATREAALWFSASTDLLATTFTLAAVLALLRAERPGERAWRWRALSLALTALAGLSKESAVVLPALAAAALLAARPQPPPPGLARRVALTVAPHLLVVLGCLVVRRVVLGGWGGSGDPGAPAAGRLLQIAAGLVNAVVGDGVLPAAVAWIAGLAVWIWVIARAARARAGADRFALAWVALAVAPLPAAGWIVGARYFYLASVGVALLLASALASRPRAAIWSGVALAAALALGGVQTARRAAEVKEYRARLDAAASAVAEVAAGGARVIHVRSGIKDLDLAVEGRLHPRPGGPPDDLLVIPDVPASFAIVPSALTARTAFLRASPPLPPSGGYRFGAAVVVGLARRDESPDLAEVIARLPEIRFLELSRATRGAISWRDVTTARRAAASGEH